jgi:hypothetical protein
MAGSGAAQRWGGGRAAEASENGCIHVGPGGQRRVGSGHSRGWRGAGAYKMLPPAAAAAAAARDSLLADC